MSRIYYSKPSITEHEIRFATDAVTTGWGEKCYEYIHRFEREFARFLNASNCIATSSCTGAIHMGLAGLGVGPGDEVILADINWIASVAPVLHLGAKPVFVDILESSWCLDPRAVEKAITPRTRAIIAVHLYGNLCDMDALQAVAAQHGIPIVEDAAEALGSRWGDVHAGTRGAFGTFSFHGSKTMTTGEGGLFVTSDDALYERVLTLSNHGRSRGETRQFWAEVIGFKYKLSNVQAAIGCAQLERLDDLLKRKREIFQFYSDAFRELPVQLNVEPDGTTNGYWMPTLVVDPSLRFNRDTLLAAFRDDNIDGRVFFWPLSSLPMFEPQRQNVVSYGIFERAVNLPSYHDITTSELERVAAVVTRVVRECRRTS